MDDSLTLYIAAKLAGYSLWAGLGFWLLRGWFSLGRALQFGLARLLIGIGFGALVFLSYHPGVGPHGTQNLLLPYLAIYGPIRWLEWSLLAKMMRPGEKLLYGSGAKGNLWRAGGIAVSFAIDLLSPEGMKGMFCVGRCLC